MQKFVAYLVTAMSVMACTGNRKPAVDETVVEPADSVVADSTAMGTPIDTVCLK